jgi:hypothetical protein
MPLFLYWGWGGGCGCDLRPRTYIFLTFYFLFFGGLHNGPVYPRDEQGEHGEGLQWRQDGPGAGVLWLERVGTVSMVGNIQVVNLRKKRNVIPDVQIRNFVNLFHNLGAKEMKGGNSIGKERKITKCILTKRILLVLFEVIDPLKGRSETPLVR